MRVWHRRLPSAVPRRIGRPRPGNGNALFSWDPPCGEAAAGVADRVINKSKTPDGLPPAPVDGRTALAIRIDETDTSERVRNNARRARVEVCIRIVNEDRCSDCRFNIKFEMDCKI